MGKIKKLANALAVADEETLKKIDEYESAGKFNDHLDTNPAPFIPVDGNYQYLPEAFGKKIKRFFQRTFLVAPFRRYTNKKLFKTVVCGKENLKGIKNAVVVCNHVNKLDSMAIEHALFPRKVYFTTAEFNNMQGFLGDMMRAGRILPMSENFAAQKNFFDATTRLLRSGNFVTFFPESAEWWLYEKPRPHKNGAYHMAVKNNVPVVPIFITFKPFEGKTKRSDIKQFFVNILKPIYPNNNLSNKENIEAMRAKAETSWQEIYDIFYNKKEANF